MTHACKVLKSNKIEFSIHEYEHDVNAKSFGLEAAEKLGLNVMKFIIFRLANVQNVLK